MIYVTGLNVKDNVMNVSVWVTHRDNWQDNAKALVARTNLVRFMKTLQNEVGLNMVRETENVRIVTEQDDEHHPSASTTQFTVNNPAAATATVSSPKIVRSPITSPKSSSGSVLRPNASPIPSTTQIPFATTGPMGGGTTPASLQRAVSDGGISQQRPQQPPTTAPSLILPSSIATAADESKRPVDDRK